MNQNKRADDLAHERFKSDFNKLFGVKPPMRKVSVTEGQERKFIKRYFSTPALRKEYEAADDAGRGLMVLEKTLEAMVEPKRTYERAALAKIEADNRTMRAWLDAIKGEIAQAESDFAEVKKRAEEAKARTFHARPFALDVNDPRAVEFIGDAIRANPGLLDKLNRPN